MFVCVRVCAYVYLCICMCMCVCLHMYVYCAYVCVCVADARTAVLASWDNNIYFFSVATASLPRTLRAHDDAVSCLSLRFVIVLMCVCQCVSVSV